MQIKDLHNMSANDWNAGFEEGMRKGYNKAIDDCIKALKERRNERYMQVNCDDVELKILAEQLKAGE